MSRVSEPQLTPSSELVLFRPHKFQKIWRLEPTTHENDLDSWLLEHVLSMYIDDSNMRELQTCTTRKPPEAQRLHLGTPTPVNKETKPNWPPDADGLFIRFGSGPNIRN